MDFSPDSVSHKFVTKFSDGLFTKFGDLENSSPNLVINPSQKLTLNTLKLIPQIEIELGHSVISLFRTRISRFEHVTGDPHFDCTVYTTDNSYEDCIRRDLKETFQNIIECQPPPFAYDLNNTCDQKLNLSHGKVVEIDKMFRHIYWKDYRSQFCSCKKNYKYEVCA